MNNFRSSRGRGRSQERGSRDRGGRREMFDAVCSNCGNDCKLPFEPRNDKPVYCSDCFEKIGGGDDRGSGRRSGRSDSRRSDSRGPRSSGIDVKEFQNMARKVEDMSQKLDKLISLMSPSEKSEKVDTDKTKNKEKVKEAKTAPKVSDLDSE